MSLQQKGPTMRTLEPLASIQKMQEESTLLAAENDFLNWNTIKGIILTRAIMMTRETTETTETHLSKTFENTHIYKESESGSENVLRLIAVAGAHPIQGELSLHLCRHHHLNVHQETQNEEFTASHLKEVVA